MLEQLKAWVRSLLTVKVLSENDPTDDDTAELVVLREYSGVPVRGLDSTDRSVQLSFRSQTPSDAHLRAWLVYRAMTPPVVIEIGGSKFWARPKQTPYHLGIDALGRTRFAFNVAIYATPDH